MCRCLACDKNLSDRESTRKGVNTGEYLDLCDNCFSTVADDFPYLEGHGKGPSGHIEDNDDEEVDEWANR